MRLISAVALAVFLLFTHVNATAESSSNSSASTSNLTRLLEAELSRLPARSGIYVKHLGTGEEAGVRANEEFESASTIKVAVMVLAFRLVDQKKLDFNERYLIKPADYRGGSGIFRYKDPGLNPTIRDVVMEMIITSDNTATDIMISKVGGKEKVNEFLRASGYQVLRQNKTTLEAFRQSFESLDPKYKNLQPEDVFALMSDVPFFVEPRLALIAEVKARSADSDARQRMNAAWERKENWFGWATPAEMARLLEGIERCTVASEQSCDEMKRMMRGQKSGDMKIRHYLTVPVAHKTGETGSVTNDVGMIYARSGTIIVSFYNADLTGPRAETEDGMGRVARLIVDYFDGKR